MVTEWFPQFDTATILLVDLANYVRSTTWTLTPNSSKYAPASNIQLTIKLTANCKTDKCVYLISCKKCILQYTSKTKKKIKTDITDTEVTSEVVPKKL